MEASLDTNVIIHLYNANYQPILFNRFEKLKLKAFIRRFWISPYSKSEKQWMISFCNENNINAKQKIQNLNKSNKIIRI